MRRGRCGRPHGQIGWYQRKFTAATRKGRRVAYRGTALMLMDCTALAYHGAVLSDTVRVADLAFLRFLGWARRPVVFDLLTTPTLSNAPPPFLVFSGASQMLFDTAGRRK